MTWNSASKPIVVIEITYIYMGLNVWHLCLWRLTYLPGTEPATCINVIIDIFTWNWRSNIYEVWHIYLGLDVSHIWCLTYLPGIGRLTYVMIDIFTWDWRSDIWCLTYLPGIGCLTYMMLDIFTWDGRIA